MRARFAAIAVVFATALSPAASIAATLKEPAPIPVTPQRHPLQLLGVAVEAVKASKHGWKIDETYGMTEVPGGYRMRVTKEWNNRHVIYAYLTTTSQSVSISYADSRELDFKQGQNGEHKIHGSYNDFTKLLTNEIAASLPLMCGDYSFLQSSRETPYTAISSSQPLARMPRTTEQIPNTGYVIREYTGFLANGLPLAPCGQNGRPFRNSPFRATTVAMPLRGRFLNIAACEHRSTGCHFSTDLVHIDQPILELSDRRIDVSLCRMSPAAVPFGSESGKSRSRH